MVEQVYMLVSCSMMIFHIFLVNISYCMLASYHLAAILEFTQCLWCAWKVYLQLSPVTVSVIFC